MKNVFFSLNLSLSMRPSCVDVKRTSLLHLTVKKCIQHDCTN